MRISRRWSACAAFFGPGREAKLNRPFMRRSGAPPILRDMSLRRAPTYRLAGHPARARGRVATARAPGGTLALAQALALALGLALVPAAAGASGRGDHERALSAVRAGEILPLPEILERLRREHPGQVLELELEDRRSSAGERVWVYEVRLLQPDGKVVKLEVDARSAHVLRGPRERARRER
jgi:uncharacterized membrane protein YkoI